MGDQSGRSRGEALPRGAIVGREDELRAITHLFEDVPQGGPRALLLAGPPGIGKTTVWLAGLEDARERGFRVLESRAAGSDAKLSYATVADLVGDAIDSLGDDVVPRRQRRAVDVAFLRADDEGEGVDGRAVALATLATLRALSDDRAVVIAVDDVQWIDGPSAAALSFALRRLRTERIVVFATLREAPGMRDPLELRRTFPRAAVVGVGPMNVEKLGTLLRSRTRGQISRSMLLRIHAASGGNPFFAIEIVRALERTGLHPAPGEPLPVPEDLGTLLLTRIRALPAATRDALLVASAALHPSVMLVRSALGSTDDVLAPAEETDIVRIVREEIAFTHPLLAAAVYRGASLDRRRTVHRRLAETVGDAEERARHLPCPGRRPILRLPGGSTMRPVSPTGVARRSPRRSSRSSPVPRRPHPRPRTPDDADSRPLSTGSWRATWGRRDGPPRGSSRPPIPGSRVPRSSICCPSSVGPTWNVCARCFRPPRLTLPKGPSSARRCSPTSAGWRSWAAT